MQFSVANSLSTEGYKSQIPSRTGNFDQETLRIPHHFSSLQGICSILHGQWSRVSNKSVCSHDPKISWRGCARFTSFTAQELQLFKHGLMYLQKLHLFFVFHTCHEPEPKPVEPPVYKSKPPTQGSVGFQVNMSCTNIPTCMKKITFFMWSPPWHSIWHFIWHSQLKPRSAEIWRSRLRSGVPTGCTSESRDPHLVGGEKPRTTHNLLIDINRTVKLPIHGFS